MVSAPACHRPLTMICRSRAITFPLSGTVDAKGSTFGFLTPASTAASSTVCTSPGTVPVTGPGLVLTVDDAAVEAGVKNPNVDPLASTVPDKGKVIARDLQIIVNGLWQAGAETISVNGHRLTSRAAIRFAGAAILVDYRPLTRPYVITAIGDPSSLSADFAAGDGGSYLQSLKANYRIRGDIKEHDSIVVPGEPALSLRMAKPVQSAVTRQAPVPTTAPPTTAGKTTAPITKQAPQPTETSP